MTESIGNYIARLESLLAENFSAEGEGLAAKTQNVAGELPDELRDLLLALAAGQNQQDALDFAFLCGQAHERLKSLAESRFAAEIAFLQPDGTQPLELENLDAVARFIKLRDQVLKTVADYTLKFLLVAFILLLIGFFLGLI